MKIDKNLTELENLLRLINSNNPELNFRPDQIKSVKVMMNVSGLYEEKNSRVNLLMADGKGFTGNYDFYYNRVTIQGFQELPEYLSPLPVLLSDTPETALARYMARYELASDTVLYNSTFTLPTEDQMFGVMSVNTDGKSLLYHQPSTVTLMRVNSLEEDLPLNRLVGTSTLDGFAPTRNQLVIK